MPLLARLAGAKVTSPESSSCPWILGTTSGLCFWASELLARMLPAGWLRLLSSTAAFFNSGGRRGSSNTLSPFCALKAPRYADSP